MAVVVICEMYGWTYYQYEDQPKPFIDLIKEKLRIDAQKAKNEAQKPPKKY